MQFTKKLRPRIKSGEISVTIRIWSTPRVKIGGRYRFEEGEIVVTAMREISFEEISDELARRSGFGGAIDLLKTAKHGKGRRVFLIEFRFENDAASAP